MFARELITQITTVIYAFILYARVLWQATIRYSFTFKFLFVIIKTVTNLW